MDISFIENGPVLKIIVRAPDPETAYKIGITILRSIQNELSGPRSGKWYPIPGNQRKQSKRGITTEAGGRNEIKGGTYQASAPYEPPAPRTGRLRNSFYMTVDPNPEADDYKVTIRTSVDYADYLETGTIHMDPRPYIIPAIEKALPKVLEFYKDAVIEFIRREMRERTQPASL